MWDVLKNGYIPLIQLFYKYINEKQENYETSEGDGSLIIFGRPSPRRCLFANSVQSISFSFKSDQRTVPAILENDRENRPRESFRESEVTTKELRLFNKIV